MTGRKLLLLASYARPHGRQISVLLLLTVLGVGLNALAPWPLKLIVDHVLAGRPLPGDAGWIEALPGGGTDAALLAWLTVGTLAIFAATHALSMVTALAQAGVAGAIHYSVGAELLAHLQRLSVQFHAQARVGDLVSRVLVDSGCVRDLLLSVVLPALTALASLVVMSVIIWHLAPILALAALVSLTPLLPVIWVLAPRMTRRVYESQVIEGQLMGVAEQTLSALPIIQAFSREEHEDRRFAGLADQSVKAYMRTLASELQYVIGVGATTSVGTALIMAIGGWQVLQGTLTVGGLLVALAYLASFQRELQTIAYLGSSFASVIARAQRVFEVLDVPELVRDSAGAKRLLRGGGECGHLRVENVTFGYELGRPVLQDVSFEARPGEIVALAGPSGSGKSTLVSLLPRFFDPWQGRIVLDGHDIRDLQLASLREQFAIVLQEPFLMPLSVADNIAYGRPGASREEIVAAAVAANADGFIRRLPDGYDTFLGERGVTLSGGERQRVAIARALVKDAPVLILDEPTSALDVETEASVMEALERLMAGRTTIIIAHRLATLRKANCIVVLKEGKVLEAGSPSELLSDDSYYRRGLYMQL